MDNDLLIRYLEGNCSEDDKVEVAKWIEEDPENLKNYLALRKLHDITIWRTGNGEDNLKEETVHIKKRTYTGKVLREALKIAAIIALTLMVYDLWTDRKIEENVIDVVAEQKVGVQTLNVPAGQRAEITLENGTKCG